jgi:hypothetical protein
MRSESGQLQIRQDTTLSKYAKARDVDVGVGRH